MNKDVELTKLEESLIVMYKSSHSIKVISEKCKLLSIENTDFSKSILNSLMLHLILELDVFIEEFDERFNSAFEKHNPRLHAIVIEICRPILKRIKKYKDIRTFRNQIIAHPWRDKKGKFSLPLNGKYNIPATIIDAQFISDLIGVIMYVLRNACVNEYKRCYDYLDKEIEKTNHLNSQNTLEVINKDLKELEFSVLEVCKKYNISIKSGLFPTYVFSD